MSWHHDFEVKQARCAGFGRRTKPGAAQARAGDLVTLILEKRLFSSPAAFALTLEARLESEDQNHHPERVMVTPPSTADDLDWMDDVLGWDTEPSDDDPGSDDEREVFGRVASLPGILTAGAWAGTGSNSGSAAWTGTARHTR